MRPVTGYSMWMSLMKGTEPHFSPHPLIYLFSIFYPPTLSELRRASFLFSIFYLQVNSAQYPGARITWEPPFKVCLVLI